MVIGNVPLILCIYLRYAKVLSYWGAHPYLLFSIQWSIKILTVIVFYFDITIVAQLFLVSISNRPSILYMHILIDVIYNINAHLLYIKGKRWCNMTGYVMSWIFKHWILYIMRIVKTQQNAYVLVTREAIIHSIYANNCFYLVILIFYIAFINVKENGRGNPK